jgi:hypothetical protein
MANVCVMVRIVADEMFPKTPLPMPRSPRFARTFDNRSLLGKAFENSILIRRQRVAKSISSSGNCRTQCMCSGSTPSVDLEWMTRLHRANDVPQFLYPTRKQIIAATLQQIDGEEVSAAGMPGAAIIGHASSIATAHMRRNTLRLLRPTRSGSPLSRGRRTGTQRSCPRAARARDAAANARNRTTPAAKSRRR